MRLLLKWILNAVAIVIAAYILPGVHVNNFGTALVAALVLGIINTIIKPILVILSLPINILTLGLFTFVINALLVLLTSMIVPGFVVNGFLWALIFSVVLSIINWFLSGIL